MTYLAVNGSIRASQQLVGENMSISTHRPFNAPAGSPNTDACSFNAIKNHVPQTVLLSRREGLRRLALLGTIDLYSRSSKCKSLQHPIPFNQALLT